MSRFDMVGYEQRMRHQDALNAERAALWRRVMSRAEDAAMLCATESEIAVAYGDMETARERAQQAAAYLGIVIGDRRLALRDWFAARGVVVQRDGGFSAVI